MKNQEIFAKIWKITEFCENNAKSENLEFRAVRRCVNLVDLEKMLKNDSLLAKIGFDTAENGPFLFFNLNPAPVLICL